VAIRGSSCTIPTPEIAARSVAARGASFRRQMALFLLAHAVDRVTRVDVDHAVASDPVHLVTSVDLDHAVASDPVDRTSSVDLDPTRHAPIVAARARKVQQGASYRRV
jgi:hypothetical protein